MRAPRATCGGGLGMVRTRAKPGSMCLHPLKQHRDVVSSDVVPNKHIRVETVQLCDEEVEQRALRRADLDLEPLVRRNRALQVPRPGALLERAPPRS